MCCAVLLQINGKVCRWCDTDPNSLKMKVFLVLYKFEKLSSPPIRGSPPPIFFFSFHLFCLGVSVVRGVQKKGNTEIKLQSESGLCSTCWRNLVIFLIVLSSQYRNKLQGVAEVVVFFLFH